VQEKVNSFFQIRLAPITLFVFKSHTLLDFHSSALADQEEACAIKKIPIFIEGSVESNYTIT